MRYRRIQIKGGTYFITATLEDRTQSLLTDNINQLKHSIKQTQKKHPFNIDAIVILPDHFHILMKLPDNDANYSLRISLIKRFFIQHLNINEPISKSRSLKRERGIWQRRFWEHHIRNDRDMIAHINYIHYNPVKHGYTLKPSDWKYTSIHRYIKDGILKPNWGT